MSAPVASVRQPVNRPATRSEYERIRDQLIDTLGRPLELSWCEPCGCQHFTVEPCLSQVPCPACGSTKQRCVRPSEHEAQDWHAERIAAFDQLRDSLESSGSPQVARWPELNKEQ